MSRRRRRATGVLYTIHSPHLFLLWALNCILHFHIFNSETLNMCHCEKGALQPLICHIIKLFSLSLFCCIFHRNVISPFLKQKNGMNHNSTRTSQPKKKKLYALRRLVQGDSETPKGALGNNVRALQPLHHRTVRTNIDFTNSMVKKTTWLIWSHWPPLLRTQWEVSSLIWRFKCWRTYTVDWFCFSFFLSLSLAQERGCVTMKTDMSYKANSWNIATTWSNLIKNRQTF